MITVSAARALTDADASKLKNQRVDALNPNTFEGHPLQVVDADTGSPVMLLARAETEDVHQLTGAAAAHSKHFGQGVVRAGGMRSRSAIFGYSAPQPQMSRPTVSAAAWAYLNPESHSTIANYAESLDKILTEFGPESVVDKHARVKEELHPDWRLKDTCWTSGIVNDTANLYYHYDKNNIPGTWSAMIVLRAGVRGGHLHVADYNLTLPCNNGDILFFPGMSLVHGVTPITRSLPSGFRYSVVYYSIKRFIGLDGIEGNVAKAQIRQAYLDETLLARQRKAGLLVEESK